MSFTVQNICDEALRVIRVLRANQQFIAPSPEYQTCIDALNQVIDGLSADAGTIFQEVRESFSLTGPTSYTIGAGATFNTPRPTKIRAASVVQADGSLPVKLVSSEKFESIIDRTVTGSFADMLTCDYGSPTATLYIWPAPSTGNLILWSYKPLAAVAALTDVITFPVGYLEVLKYNLAVAIAPEFPGAVLDPLIVQKAEQAKARLAALNATTVGAPYPPVGPAPAQQPLGEIDIEQAKPLSL